MTDKEILDRVTSHIRSVYFGLRQKDLLPILEVETLSGELYVFGTGFPTPSPAKRELIVRAIRGSLKSDIVRYAYFSESYVLHTNLGDSNFIRRILEEFGSLENHPDAKEQVMIVSHRRSCDPVIWTLDVERDSQGYVTSLGEPQELSGVAKNSIWKELLDG